VRAENDRTQERDRAVRAEQDRTEQLCRAELALARAGRLKGEAGQHFGGLVRIQHAMALRGREKLTDVELLDLRNEAIACLAAPDARPLPLRGSAEEYDLGGYAVDPGMEHYTYLDRKGQLILRRLADDQVVKTLPPPQPKPGVRFWYGSALFSPDGRFLAVAYVDANSNRRLYLIWDLQTGRTVLQKESPGGGDFHPDSRTFATHTPDGNITLYRLPEGEEMKRIELKEPAPVDLSFDPTGRKIACLFNKNEESVQILDMETGKAEFSFPLQGSRGAPAWSPDSRWLAAGASDCRIYVYDTVRRRLHSVLEGHEETVAGLAFSPKGNLLASVSHDNTTRLWDPVSGKQWVKMVGWFVRFSSNGRRLAFIGTDRNFGIWELAEEGVCRTLHHGAVAEKSQPKDHYSSGTWAVSFGGDDGRLLASASHDGVRFWDARTAQEVNHLAIGHAGSVQFDPRGGGFVTHGVAGLLYWPLHPDPAESARSWRVGPPRTLFQPGSAHSDQAAWDRQGHWLAFNDPHKRGALVWNLEPPTGNGQGADRFSGQPVELPGQGRQRNILTTVLSPNGRWAAASYWNDPRVHVWETADPKPPQYLGFTRADDYVRLAAFSPDNQWLVVGSLHNYHWWRVGTWEPGPTLAAEQVAQSTAPLAFTPDGALLAISRTPYTVQLVDPATGREFATLTAPDRHMVKWLAFNPDGTQLAVAARDHVVQLWDLRLLRSQLAKLELDWDRPPYPLHGVGAPGRLHAQRMRGGVAHPGFRGGFMPGFRGGFGPRINGSFMPGFRGGFMPGFRGRFDRFEDRFENRFNGGMFNRRFDRFEDRFENRFNGGMFNRRFDRFEDRFDRP
jgi:WD40 repeat protein